MAWPQIWLCCLALVLLAWQGAFWLRFNLEIPPDFQHMAFATAVIPLAAYAFSLVFFHVHRQVWRFAGLLELRQIAQAAERHPEMWLTCVETEGLCNK